MAEPTEPDPGDTVTASIRLSLGGTPFEAEVELPAGPATAGTVLPFARKLSDAIVDAFKAETERAGRRISCRLGCAACCRQAVPVSVAEARRLTAVVDAMPEPRRGAVRARFDDARRRLEEAGLVAELMAESREEVPDAVPLALRYFRLGIACPFLESEACSIYADRPLACREYVVTTPAENCWRLGEDEVEAMTLPVRVSVALTHISEPVGDGGQRWLPLVLAPDWVAAHPAPEPTRTGPEVLAELFRLTTGKDVDAAAEMRKAASGQTMTG